MPRLLWEQYPAPRCFDHILPWGSRTPQHAFKCAPRSRLGFWDCWHFNQCFSRGSLPSSWSAVPDQQWLHHTPRWVNDAVGVQHVFIVGVYSPLPDFLPFCRIFDHCHRCIGQWYGELHSLWSDHLILLRQNSQQHWLLLDSDWKVMHTSQVILVVLLLSGCASKNEARSLFCFGFCAEQSFNRDVTPSPETVKELKTKEAKNEQADSKTP